MSSLKIWNRIEDRSKLELWLESNDTGFLGAARCLADNGSEESWTHAQLAPGPKRKSLVSPRRYAIRVRVAFTGSTQATVDIRARVVKPNGDVHGTPYVYTVRGTTGTIRRATIICNTSSR